MAVIGWNCKCGKNIEEGKDFTWTFQCAKLDCGVTRCIPCNNKTNFIKKGGSTACGICGILTLDTHSKECNDKDWEAKEALLKKVTEKHVATCNKAQRCKSCSIPFSYNTEYIKVTDSDRAGDYHKKCWEKVKEEDDQPKCSKCGVRFKGKPDALYCDKCHAERERERERETKMTSRNFLILSPL